VTDTAPRITWRNSASGLIASGVQPSRCMAARTARNSILVCREEGTRFPRQKNCACGPMALLRSSAGAVGSINTESKLKWPRSEIMLLAVEFWNS
jgi:hypothetical protein